MEATGTIVPASSILEGGKEREGADDEGHADSDAGPGKPGLEDGRVEHRDGHQDRPHPPYGGSRLEAGECQAAALPRQVGRRIGESFLNPQMAQ